MLPFEEFSHVQLVRHNAGGGLNNKFSVNSLLKTERILLGTEILES